MAPEKCPGSSSSSTEIVEIGCPNCGAMVEFFPRDIVGKCNKCGEDVLRSIEGNPCFLNCPVYESCQSKLSPQAKKKILEEKQRRRLFDGK